MPAEKEINDRAEYLEKKTIERLVQLKRNKIGRFVIWIIILTIGIISGIAVTGLLNTVFQEIKYMLTETGLQEIFEIVWCGRKGC